MYDNNYHDHDVQWCWNFDDDDNSDYTFDGSDDEYKL